MQSIRSLHHLPKLTCVVTSLRPRLFLALALTLPVVARAEFTLAFRPGVTTYPGTSTLIAGTTRDAVIHNNGVLFATRNPLGPTQRYSLLHHRAGALTVLLNETGGFPGGGDILNIFIASDSTSAFATVERASGPGTSDRSALVRVDAGSSVAVIPNSATIIPGTPATTGFTSPSFGGGRVAFVGTAAGRSQYVYRAVGTTATLIAQENVTLQPGGPGRFNAFLSPVASPDGSRIFFTGLNSAATTSPDYRRGLYVEQSGIITRLLDNTTDVPGAAVKFDPTAETPGLFLSANGSHVVVRAGSKRADLAVGADRFGLYRYSTSGVLTRVADNTTTAGGDTLVEPGALGAAVANDGTVFFLAVGAQRLNLYRAGLDGTVSLVVRNSADFQSMTRLWLYGANVYLLGVNAAFERVLLRIPVAGGTPAVALNLTTHPAFSPLNARDMTRFEVAGNLTLVEASGNILYAPASDVDGSAPVDSTNAPRIATAPQSQTISSGGTAVFSVAATGVALSYQWRFNGTPIAGATGATYVIRAATAANSGNYTNVITNSLGSITSAAATLTISTNPNFGRISNLSILTDITAADPQFTVGTVIGGAATTGSKALLVRAAGPSLSALGVGSPLADPKLEIFSGQSVVASNDNWSGDTALSTAFSSVGAFAYANAASRDAAVFNPATAAAGYTVQVSGVNGTTGPVIAELYDATPAGSFAPSTPRLVNVSVLKTIPTNSLLTAGFVIGGSTAKTVLVRAIGPRLALAPFGVTGAMADPKLELFSGQTVIASNDNWGGDAQLTTVGNAVGAFAVTDTTSKDAMLLVTLAPGNYTVQASPATGTAGGPAIVEVYEVP